MVDAQPAISWQQEACLRNEAQYGQWKPVPLLTRLPDSVRVDDLQRHLEELVRQEDALRIRTVTLDDGGRTDYVPSPTVSVPTVRCATTSELLRAIGAEARTPTERDGSPLWRMSLLDGPDAQGRPGRFLMGAFDHLICDRWSLDLLTEALLQRDRRVLTGAPGTYRDWVSRQRERFSWPVRGRSDALDFWLDHLGGTPAERDTPLPFATERRASTGLVATVTRDLASTIGGLDQAARAHRTTVFGYFLGHLVAEIAEAGRVTDCTVRVVGNFRPRAHQTTFGWFADALPLRVDDPDLADRTRALQVCRSRWFAVLQSGHAPPWDYLRMATAPGEVTQWQEPAGRQLAVNFLLSSRKKSFFDELALGDPGSQQSPEPVWSEPSDIDGFYLRIGNGPADGCRLQASFNPDDFDADGVRTFLDSLADHVDATTRAAASG